MDNTALEITVAILWTIAVFVLPVISVFVGGLRAILKYGVKAKSSGGTGFTVEGDPFTFISEDAKKAFFTVIWSLVIGAVLCIGSVILAVNAWVAVAS
jgi:hypothetical protein